MPPLNESIRATLAAFGLSEAELDPTVRARLARIVTGLPEEGRSSFAALLYVELSTERQEGQLIDSDCVRRVSERIAKRVQREAQAARGHYRSMEDPDILADGPRGVHLDPTDPTLWTALAKHLDADDLALLHKRIVERQSTASLAVEYELSRSQISRRLQALVERLRRALAAGDD